MHHCFTNFFLFLVNPDGSLIILPTPLAANGGGNATFTCLSLSISPSNLIWKFNGSVLSNGGRYEIAQYYLTIAGVVGEDHGLYTCELTNLAGSSSTSSSLIGILVIAFIGIYFSNY